MTLQSSFRRPYSEGGASRRLLLIGSQGEISLVISPLVLEETRRNLVAVSPDLADLFDLLVAAIPFELVHPSKDEVLAASQVVALKDAPILAAARNGQVDLLVTLDKKHLLGKPELVEYAGMPIVTPREALHRLE